MEIKGVVVWIVFLVLCAVVLFVARRIKKQIETGGIETTGVISRITDVGAEDIDLRYYARYRTEDGEEIEGVLSNPSSDLEVGQRVRLKYHPKLKQNARIIKE